MSIEPDPIEAYLDDLLAAARVLPVREARYLLAESEAHLRDAAETAVASGASQHEANAVAVLAFGPARELVGQERARSRTPVRILGAQAVRTGFVLGAIGAVAVGVSGAIAGLIYWIGGAGAIAPIPRAADLTASNCARWTGLVRGLDCRHAALSDWAAETIWYRVALGLIGVIALLTYRVTRRRHAPAGLEPVVTESIATTLFVCAAVTTLALGVDSYVTASGSGAGQWLSATPVAIAAAAIFGARLTRRLREPLVI
ncbi:MAG: hypothetical protein ABI232_08840 [Jatrophihabitantaceae bacterium]